MKRTTCLILVLVCMMLVPQRRASAHGFELDLVNNKIEAHPENQQNFSDHVFFSPLNQANAHDYFADHGSVEAESGINPGSDTLQITFLSPLWYSGGGTAQRATSGITLEATSYDSIGNQLGNSVDITGTSVNLGGFPVAGDDAHSIGWELFNPGSDPAIPQGVYGFSYRVDGYQNGNPSTPFVSSDPLVVVFNTPTFTDGATLSAAQSAVFSAIMRGDFNLDGRRTSADISQMLGALADLGSYQTSRNLEDADLSAIADVNRDGKITGADIQTLLNILKSGDSSVSSVPEPSGIVLIGSAALGFMTWQWRQHRRGG
jgi:hypothetical protein